jgi:hypothetical protein
MSRQKRWRIYKAEVEKTGSLFQALKIHRALCAILVQRGIGQYEAARDFFRPQLSGLHSPWLMKDMDKAVARILQAFRNGEKILVFGDYDVDGTTAVACVYQFLKTQYDAVEFYIPHRYREGYGVSQAGIDYAKEAGYSLIIALDCGIKSVGLTRGEIMEAYEFAERWEHVAKSAPTTAWGFVHGLTRLSQREPHADQRNRMDRAGGKVLALAAGGRAF